MVWLRAALAVVLLGAGLTGRAQYTIRWLNDPGAPAVEVGGIPRDALEALAAAAPEASTWHPLFPVYAEQPPLPGAPPFRPPPMAGTWKVTAGKLRFEPRFPFVPGVTYRAEFWPDRLPRPLGGDAILRLPDPSAPAPASDPVVAFFELPRGKNTPVTTVAQIYPSADVLPENQLKFYVHFSGPMSRGGIYDHVQLREASGGVVELPFLELDEELWDPEMTRLTLLIDPGRIKRGVKPLEDMGPVFEEGKSYTLSIKPTWRDAAGRPLRTAYEKTFRIGPADRTPPDPRRWRIQYVPPAGTEGPLIVLFDEPMDRPLALRLISVTRIDAAGAAPVTLVGEGYIDSQERRWLFQPIGPWRGGAHQLVVRTTIEDLAGNNIGKTFDVELAAGGPRQLAAPVVVVPFNVK